jgi:hypothetical protein
MDQFIAAIKAFLAVFPSPFKTMLTLVCLVSIALFLPATWQQSMGVFVFGAEHRVLEWGILLFCGPFLLLSIAETAGKRYLSKRRINKRLQNLADDEKRTLNRFLTQDKSTVIMWPHEGGVETLQADGIFVRRAEVLGDGQFVYALTPTASELLRGKEPCSSLERFDLGFARFRRLLSIRFELGFCCEAFSFVLRHGCWIVQHTGRVRLCFYLLRHKKFLALSRKPTKGPGFSDGVTQQRPFVPPASHFYDCQQRGGKS